MPDVNDVINKWHSRGRGFDSPWLHQSGREVIEVTIPLPAGCSHTQRLPQSSRRGIRRRLRSLQGQQIYGPTRCAVARFANGSLAAQSHWARIVASAAPANCATMKARTPAGAIPAKVFERARAKVTAGFANEVEAVNQYAAVM